VQSSAFDYLAWESGVRSFGTLGAAVPRSMNLLLDGEPRRLEGAAVTPSYFGTLGLEPALGRSFTEEESRGGGSAVAVLGYGLWQEAFAGQMEALGKSLLLNGRSHTVIGVLPPGFDLPFGTSVWVPMSFDRLSDRERLIRDLFVTARLREGASFSEAQEELVAVADRLALDYPRSHEGWSAQLIPLRRLLLDDFDGHLRPALLALGAAVSFLWLIACANVGNLFLARVLDRNRELALRTALGGGGFRLLRQLLVEGMVLAGLGGALGVLVAYGSLPALLAGSPSQPLALGAYLHDVTIDPVAMGFTLLVTIGTGLAIGLAPAHRVSRTSPMQVLREGGRSAGGRDSRRRMRFVVMAEVALAVALIGCAALMVRSFERLSSVDLGFDPGRILVARLGLPPNDYPEHSRRADFIDRVLLRVRAVPGVESAGMTTNLPLDHLGWDAFYVPEGGAPVELEKMPSAADRLVSPGYLETLGVELREGRLIGPEDLAGRESVVVITEDLARRAWPGQSPLGKRIQRRRPGGDGPASIMTVVGVIAAVKEDRAAFRSERPAWYVPYPQFESARDLTLVVKTEGDPENAAAPVRAAVASAGSTVPVYGVTTLRASLVGFLSQERFAAVLLSLFAGLGLLLAALGIYGVLSYSVVSRTQEIAILVALGADRRSLLRRFVLEGMAVAGAGLALGLAVAAFAARLIGNLLFEVAPADPASFIVTAIVVLASALLASTIPARRASRLDPMRALR
jgi:putative ABC transport system permease protein